MQRDHDNPMYVYMDGQFKPAAEASVSVFDHGLLYGDGVFEGIRVYDGTVFRLPQHIKRLYQSAQCLLLAIPLTPEEMTEAILETVRRRGLPNQYVRAIVTRGAGDLGLNPRLCKQPSVIIIADTIALYPESVYREGLAVATVATRRTPTWAVDRVLVTGFANPLMGMVYGAQYVEGARALQVLIWFVPISLISGHYRFALVSIGKPSLDLYSTIVGTGALAVLNALLITQYGLLGAAWAMLAAEVLTWGAAYYFVTVQGLQRPYATR